LPRAAFRSGICGPASRLARSRMSMSWRSAAMITWVAANVSRPEAPSRKIIADAASMRGRRRSTGTGQSCLTALRSSSRSPREAVSQSSRSCPLTSQQGGRNLRPGASRGHLAGRLRKLFAAKRVPALGETGPGRQSMGDASVPRYTYESEKGMFSAGGGPQSGRGSAPL
jgi:hypothetical protein